MWRLHYRVHSKKVKSDRWYPTKAEAIPAFERKCKPAGIQPPLPYPLSVNGDSITNNLIAYPRYRRAVGCGMVTAVFVLGGGGIASYFSLVPLTVTMASLAAWSK